MKIAFFILLFMMTMGCDKKTTDTNWKELVKIDVVKQLNDKYTDLDYETMRCMSEDPQQFSDHLWQGGFHCYSTHMSRRGEYLLHTSGSYSVVKDNNTTDVMFGTKIDIELYRQN